MWGGESSFPEASTLFSLFFMLSRSKKGGGTKLVLTHLGAGTIERFTASTSKTFFYCVSRQSRHYV